MVQRLRLVIPAIGLFAKNVDQVVFVQGEEHEELRWPIEMMLYGLKGKIAEE